MLLLVLSVGIKIIAGNQSVSSQDRAVPGTAENEIVTFLDRHRFQVGEVENEASLSFVPASMGDCRLLAALAAPQGWHRDIVHQLASQYDQVFFVFGGVIYQDQPTWLTLMHEYWRALNSFAGRKLPIRPVLGIVASPTCNLRDMPWQELAKLS